MGETIVWQVSRLSRRTRLVDFTPGQTVSILLPPLGISTYSFNWDEFSVFNMEDI